MRIYRKKEKGQQMKVGHKEKGSCRRSYLIFHLDSNEQYFFFLGSSSNRPELAAFVLALRSTPATKPMLYVCDNEL